MAQENANILHAGLQINGVAADDPATDPPQIVSATGIEVADVILRQDLPAISASVMQVDLVAGIADEELVVSGLLGTLAPVTMAGVPTPVPTTTPATAPLNIVRPSEAADNSQANLEKRRFWILLNAGVGSFHVEWWRIPPFGAPTPTGFVPLPGGGV